MDPISITTTVITVATFFKDVLELALSLKESVEKIGRNKSRLRELVDDIHNTLSQLEQFSESHDLSRESTFALLNSLKHLERELRAVLERCHKVLPRFSSRNFGAATAKVKAKVTAWHQRDDIEVDISRLRELIVAYHCQFTAFAAARIEHTAVRIEQSLLIQMFEHRLKYERLEFLMANKLLDSQNARAQAIFNRVSIDLAADIAKQGVEARYLRLKVNNLTTKITLSLPLLISRYTGEEVKRLPTPFPLQHGSLNLDTDQLVADVLTFSHSLEVNNDPVSHLSSIARRLNQLAMYSDALALDLLLVQIFRQLVVKDPFRFSPRLALALSTLAFTQQKRGAFEDAQATMQIATAYMERVKRQYPDCDFRDLSAFILAAHANAFMHEGQFDECLRISKQAHDEQLILLAAVENDPATGLTSEGRDASLVLLAHWSRVILANSLCRTGSPAEAFSMAKSALRLLFSLSRDYIQHVGLNDAPKAILETIFTSLAAIYQTTGSSLTPTEDVVLLYCELINQHPEQFSGHLIRIVFAFSYLCHIQAQNLNFQLLEDQRAVFDSIILDNGMPTRHCHFDAFLAYMKTRGFERDIMKDMIFTFLTFDRTKNFIPYSLEVEVRELIAAIVLDDIPLAVGTIRQAILHYRNNSLESVDTKAFRQALFLISQFVNEDIATHTSTFLPILEELHVMARENSKKSKGAELSKSWTVSAYLLTSATIKASKFVEARVLAKEIRETPNPPAILFEVLTNFADRWYTMGQLDDSLQCISDGIALAKKHPPIHENDYVCSNLYLVNLSANILDSLGFKSESAIVLEEALRLCPGMHDHGHKCDGATSIVADVARMLTERGRPDDALEISEQATNLATAQGDDDFEHAYARDIRSRCLATLGRNEEALQVAEEGMERRRKGMEHLSKRKAEIQTLSEARLHAYSEYAVLLAYAERTTEALAANYEAIRVLRSYPKSQVGRWPILALVLEQRSQLLWKLERKEEALETCEEVVKIRRSIGGKYFKQWVLLPTTLERLADYLRAMGRIAEATAAQVEAAHIWAGIETKVDRPPALQEAIVSAMMDHFPRYRAQRRAALDKNERNNPRDNISSPPILSPPSESTTASASANPTTSQLVLHQEFEESAATLVAESDTKDSEGDRPIPTPTDGKLRSLRTEPPRRRASQIPTLDSGRGRMETIKQNVTFLASIIVIIWALLKAWVYLREWARSLEIPFSL